MLSYHLALAHGVCADFALTVTAKTPAEQKKLYRLNLLTEMVAREVSRSFSSFFLCFPTIDFLIMPRIERRVVVDRQFRQAHTNRIYNHAGILVTDVGWMDESGL